MKIEQLPDYQEKSVVSKEILKKEAGGVTVFAFDKGEGLREHTAPFDALVYIIDGEANIQIDQKDHHLKADQMIVMPANRPHALKAVTAFKMMLVMIKSPE